MNDKAKGSRIELELKKFLESSGFEVWRPAHAKYCNNDIFGLWDMVARSPVMSTYYFQVSTRWKDSVWHTLFKASLVFSAAFTGFLVFGRPIMWYLDGKKKEAMQLFFSTLILLLMIAIVIFIFIIMLIK